MNIHNEPVDCPLSWGPGLVILGQCFVKTTTPCQGCCWHIVFIGNTHRVTLVGIIYQYLSVFIAWLCYFRYYFMVF